MSNPARRRFSSMGDRYKSVSIRKYISVQRGFRDIICMIEGEYIDENRIDKSGGQTSYVRKVEAQPLGYFDKGRFSQGIKYLPMIQDSVFLRQEERVHAIFDRDRLGDKFNIGTMLNEEVAVSLPWKRLFNSHIGIFGNTGSGKSNTLAKLYSVLFEQKLSLIEGKSQFVVFDFNGEYGGSQLASAESKQIYSLSTATQPHPYQDSARFPLAADEFWESETLSVLFQATTNTQRPFLNRVISGKKRYETNPGSLAAYAKSKFRAAFFEPERLGLLR
jgi:uncharacterized protein